MRCGDLLGDLVRLLQANLPALSLLARRSSAAGARAHAS